MKTLSIGIAAFSLLLVAGCGSSDGSNAASGGSASATNGAPTTGGSAALTGAGSTFVNPAMSKWAFAYQQANPGVTINYQSVGSGAGIAQLQAGTVDFAASDVPLDDKDLKAMPTPTTQFPVIGGCEVLAYNLPGIDKGLKLPSDVIADIFLGKITTWNDARITKENPTLTLPATPITVAHRSDGSGTTYIFTDYLSSVSPAWSTGPGKGKTVNWPVGVGGKGNEGVAGLVKQTPGAIGYVELAYAVQAKLTYGPVKNKLGNYVDPSVESTSAAAEAAADSLKKDIRTSIVNGASAQAYPISGFTYVLLSKAPKDAAKGKALQTFLEWVLGPGQDMAKELQYAPLPAALVDLDKTELGAPAK